MLFLLFQLEAGYYAIDTSQVVEVLPVTQWKPIPDAPRGVAGYLNYHGSPLPLVDLSDLVVGKPSRRWLSTRIVLVKYPPCSGGTRILGLVVERVAETRRWRAEDFQDGGVRTRTASFLGPVIATPEGLVQRIEIDRLLTSELQDLLLSEPAGGL